MNKKFFTLLVALLATVSMGVSAVTGGAVPITETTYSTSKLYLMKTDGDRYLAVTPEGTLVTIDIATVATYSQLQAALWKVTATPGSTGTSVPTPATYEYTNAAFDIKLSLPTENAVVPGNIAAGDNTLGGDIDRWIASSNTVTPQDPNYFYVTTKSQNVITMGANASNEVVPVKYGDLAALQAAVAGLSADEVLVITPQYVTGEILLSANDVNTWLGKQGVYEPAPTAGFYATKDTYFQLGMTPKNTLDNPLTGELQAIGVTVTAADDETLATDAVLDVTDGFRNTTDLWVALQPKGQPKDATGKFIVVDTTYIEGTDQMFTPRLQTKVVDKFYNATTNNKRLRDSYLYQFSYNGANNTVSVKVRAYINKPTNTLEPEEDVTWVPGEAKVVDDATNNAYIFGTDYNGIDDGGWMNYLTYAKLAHTSTTTAVVYTWGEETDMQIKLDVTSKYTAFRVPTGVYLLQVTGSKTETKDRIGKYLKESLDGTTEYVEQAIRQNFQHMPSAQWVIESTVTNTAKITNREFADRLGLDGRVTYKTTKANEFFFLGGDTIQYIAVTDIEDEKQGYKYVAKDSYSYLDNFSFRYLHELAMDKPVFMKDGEPRPLFVNSAADADAVQFRLEEVTVDTYGYTTPAIAKLAQLERSVYRVATYDAISYEDAKYYVTYDPQNKQYFLVESETGNPPATASQFFLKENNEVTADGSTYCYYTFLEAEILNENIVRLNLNDNSELVVDKVFDGGIVYDADLNPLLGTFVIGVKNTDNQWVAKTYAASGDVPTGYTAYSAGSVFYAQIPLEGGYSASDYATSKVSVDNNTLALTNGVLPDNQTKEVANSAFKVEPDDNILYRTIGKEEGENALEQNLRIYRVNATAKEYLYEDANSVYSDSEGEGKGPNKPNGERLNLQDQYNFLGVEGKGDDKLAEAVMTARYVRGTVMPQYLLMVNYKNYAAEETACPVCQDLLDAGLPVPENCPHDEYKEGYSTARVLVSLTDSIGAGSSVKDKSVFKWNTYTRLAFVDARFTPGEKTGVKDSIMTIVRSNLTTNRNTENEFAVKFTAEETPKEGTHKDVFFSFRLIEEGNKQFMMESAGAIGGKTANTWVKVQNGVPVLVPTTFNDALNGQAELFDIEITEDAATSNTGIEAGAVKVIAGTGAVTIKGAAGQQVTIANILGQTVYTGVVSADEVTIAAPAGVVVVSVAGEATKALVK